MKATVQTDTVLDLIRKHQVDLAGRLDRESTLARARDVLWVEYKKVSELYDAVRKASE